jgi:hydroxymethylglutaryl-CoA lyase
MRMSLPRQVDTEVGMRDGFQIEPIILPTARKIEVGRALIAAGVRSLEANSFVSTAAVLQLRS